MALSTGSKVFLVFLVLILGGVGGGLWFVNEQLAGTADGGEPVQLEIPRGAGSQAIAEQLEEAGIIKNALAFRLVARARGATFQAGEYTLQTGMSVDEALAALAEGPELRETMRFTIREGLSVPLILESLDEQFDQYTQEEFRAVLDATIQGDEGALTLPAWAPDLTGFEVEVKYPFEGLLFPETYEVYTDETPQQVLQMLVDQTAMVMESIPAEQKQATAERLETEYSPEYAGLIVASLIERETRVNEERPMVSSVIYNRLREDQPLQIDATVLYALGKWQERVLREDTNVESPYNTYTTPGLPPTPISNAGRASIEAAFAPQDTPFFYYVLSPECDGTHQFAETLEQHNRNVAEFREAGRCLEG